MTSICAPVCVSTIEEMRRVVEEKTEGADIIELRLDCLDKLAGAAALISDLKGHDKPLILTLRAPEQGGHGSFDYDTRRHFWLSLKDYPSDCWFDLEYDLFQGLSTAKSAAQAFAPADRVICSYHDFSGTPANLDRLYQELAGTTAGT